MAAEFTLYSISKSKVRVRGGGGGGGDINRRDNMGFLKRKKMPSVSQSVFRVIKDTLNVIV